MNNDKYQNSYVDLRPQGQQSYSNVNNPFNPTQEVTRTIRDSPYRGGNLATNQEQRRIIKPQPIDDSFFGSFGTSGGAGAPMRDSYGNIVATR